MKLFTLSLFLSLVSLIFTGCSSDPNSNKTANVGTNTKSNVNSTNSSNATSANAPIGANVQVVAPATDVDPVRTGIMKDADAVFSAAQACKIKPDVDKAAKILSHGYQGPFRLFWGDGQYLGHGFVPVAAPDPTPADDPTVWVAQFGDFQTLHAYWIYLPHEAKAWQAEKDCGRLLTWNEDGRANPKTPQDMELFYFESVDPTKAVVRVKSIYGCYVRFQDGHFINNGNVTNAALFAIE